MSKNDIILEIYNDNYIKKLCSSFSSKLKEYKEDFEQYMYEVILNVPEDKLIDMYNKKELNFYIYYICKAQVYNNSSDFWKETKGRLDVAFSIDDPNYKQLSGGE